MKSINETLHPEVIYVKASEVNDSVDVGLFFKVLWRSKLAITMFTLFSAVIAVCFAISMPNTYRASVIVMPTEVNNANSLSRLAGQFGGLTSLAGLNMGGGDSKTNLALEVLNSRDFIVKFVRKHGLTVPLIAGEDWEKTSDLLVLDPSVYNAEKEAWVEGSEGEGQSPSSWLIFKEFKKRMNISKANESGSITFTFEFYSPNLAKEWLKLLIQDINQKLREDAVNEAKENIKFLTENLDNTMVKDVRSSFYQLIQEQTKSFMLAEVTKEYVFKTVDPANVPDEKHSPKRTLIVLLGLLLGLTASCVVVTVLFLKSTEK